MSLLPALGGAFGDHPDAIVVDGVATSWSELSSRAGALAARLAGAPAVAVPGAPTLDTVVAVVAGIMAGAPVVPVPADAGPVERGHVLRDSGAALVLGEPDWPDVALPRVPIDAGSEAAALSEPADREPALIMYTSGTTGLPKGAVISRRAIAADLDGLADAWTWTPDDRLVHGLPLFHVHGLVLGVLGALRVGSRLVHTGRPTPERYADAGGSLYFGVPTVWARVVGSPDHARALSSARLLVSGSAPLPVPVFEALRDLAGQAPVERYGMTETLITVSTRADGDRRPGHVGLPIAGVETRLRSDDPADDMTSDRVEASDGVGTSERVGASDGVEVPHDGETIGGLQVRGATLFDGYLGLPDVTAASMTDDGWFVTGDAVTIGPDGFHRIVGRASIDIIKTGGFKVGAGEVETALLSHPAVAEAAVVGLPDDDLGERIVAYMVPSVDRVTDTSVLVEHVASTLAAHKRPRQVRLVDVLPRNAMGKVQKQQLRARD